MAGMFELAQRLPERDAFVPGQLELARNLDLIERPVITRREEGENVFP